MVFENLQVRHKTFGLGTIVSKDGKYIKVKFDNAEKNFVYPDSFEKFLTLEDGTVSDEILADLAVTNAQKAKILAAKNEENLRAMTMAWISTSITPTIPTESAPGSGWKSTVKP